MKATQPFQDSKRSMAYEVAQESAKTDGMSKGPATQGGGGSDGDIFAKLKRSGGEYAQESAKTDGLCK